MNGSSEETALWVKSAMDAAVEFKSVDVGISPPFVYLETAVKIAGDSGVLVGAQNCYWKESGAFTGEVSPRFLKDIGCDFVILGHSERRTIFGEKSPEISKKIAAAAEEGLKVILCVGETESERDKGETTATVEKQLDESLASVATDALKNIDIAYEPVWAIGTGKVATGEIAQEVHFFIRNYLRGRFNGASFRILYGGSVKPSNWGELNEKPDIDGALVGGVSLIPTDFRKLIQLSKKGE